MSSIHKPKPLNATANFFFRCVELSGLMNLTSNDEQTWLLLRERSLQPGGFGEDRARIWPALLGAQPLSDPPPYSEVESEDENLTEEGSDESIAEAHADERQIKLDTDRSFVLYPGESSTMHPRDALQNDLHGLLVSLFRKRRSLHYFQGFHDIMTVIFLTLPQPLHLPCAERMALHRVRDSMGVGLEPVLGLLRVLRNLLRLVDPTYARLLESTSPLPYHALSHLLTLFSHDVPTLPLIQHVWDFLLAREPIAVVWLAAALILHRKPSIYLLAEQDDDGMIHSLLGGIPELVDADPEFYDMRNNVVAQDTTRADYAAENVRLSGRSTASIAHEQPDSAATDRAVGSLDMSEQMDSSCDTFTPDEDQNSVISNVVLNGNRLRADSSSPSSNFFPLQNTTDGNHVGSPHSSTLDFAASIPLPDSRPVSPGVPLEPSFSVPLSQEAIFTDYHSRSPSPSTPHHVPSRSRSLSGLTEHSSVQLCGVANESTTHVDTSVKTRFKPPPLSLTHLLRQADDLLNAYPPSHPSVRLTEIMGPDSAMRTWRPSPITTTTRVAVPEKQPYNETDDYLETLVNSSQIVIPSPPPSPLLGPRLVAKKTKNSPRVLSKALMDPRRVGRRLGALTAAERRILFMGALLVVGAAVALKSSKVPYVDSIVKAGGGDGLKRLWNEKWTLMSSMVAAWGRGLP